MKINKNILCNKKNISMNLVETLMKDINNTYKKLKNESKINFIITKNLKTMNTWNLRAEILN